MKEHFQDQSLEDVVSDTFDEDYQYDTNLPQTKFDSTQDYSMNESFGYRQGKTFITKIYILTFQCCSGIMLFQKRRLSVYFVLFKIRPI